MKSNVVKQNKHSETKWRKYQQHSQVPTDYKDYLLSSELDEVLIDHSPYLKQRISKTMKKMHRESIKDGRHLYLERFDSPSGHRKGLHSQIGI
jgi:hypothetical protein